MPQGNDAQEKTEEATPKRLREARKKGQVAKSRDLTTMFVMIFVFLTIALFGANMGSDLKELMNVLFGFVEHTKITEKDIATALEMSLRVLAKVLAPIFIAGVVSALFIGFIQVGPIMSAEVLKPKFEKLNPVEGAKNMFKMVTFIELIKNIAKITLVVYLAYLTIDEYLQEILLSSKVDVLTSMKMTGEIIASFFIKVMVVFFVIALIDMAVQRWNFMKNMRMSKDEVKREYKQDEGDPAIKSERRRIHREMVFGNVKQNVKKSDVVVTNPVHVAVAIQYAKDDMAAPEVLVKGQRKFAEMIIQIAREEGIPIVRNIPLAWSLLQIEEGDAIPEDLYEPVAEVLCYVYEMEEARKASQQKTAYDSGSETRPQDFDPF